MKRIIVQVALATLAIALPSYADAQAYEMEQDMFESAREGDKAAVVAVHAGSDDAVTLQRMNRFNDTLRKAFPQCDFREAWTSKATASRAGRCTPDELLHQLKKEGFTHVLIQPSYIANGTEMQYLRSTVEAAKESFLQIRLGEPLLHDASDYEKVIDLAAKAYGAEKSANVLLCFGHSNEEGAQTAMLEYAMRDKGLVNWHAALAEGYPSTESTIRLLKAGKAKKVNIIPFSFGDDAQYTATEISDWALTLKKAGYKVTAEAGCMGDLDGIITLFEQHCKHAKDYRTLNAKERLLLK